MVTALSSILLQNGRFDIGRKLLRSSGFIPVTEAVLKEELTKPDAKEELMPTIRGHRHGVG